jgi:cell wall-associated NlpC family hydrolase
LVRTSYGLAELGETIKLSDIQPGDLMFFKGSNVNSTVVGHVAMVIEVTPSAIKFIHSANGGVRIDNFKTSEYYIRRYVKTKRLDYGG